MAINLHLFDFSFSLPFNLIGLLVPCGRVVLVAGSFSGALGLSLTNTALALPVSGELWQGCPFCKVNSPGQVLHVLMEL